MPRPKRSQEAARAAHQLDELARALQGLQRLRSSKQVYALLGQAIGTNLPRQAIEALTALGEETMPVAEVAKRARMDVSATSRQLRDLERSGYLKKQPSAEKRSVVLVGATAEGRALFRQVRSVQNRHLSRALADWDEQDRRRLATLLDRLVADLQETPYEAALSSGPESSSKEAKP